MRKALPAFLVLAALVAGCGSTKKHNDANDYALSVQRAQFAFANEFDKATNTLLRSTDPGHDAKALRAAAKVATTDADTLRAIVPPSEVRAQHRQLVNLVDGYSTTLNKAARLVAGGDPKAFVRAKTLLTQSSAQVVRRFNQLIGQINARLR